MNDLSAIISALNLVGLGGVGLFLYYLFKASMRELRPLPISQKNKRKSLRSFASVQRKWSNGARNTNSWLRTSRTSEKDWIRVGMNLSNGVTAEVRFYPR